VPEDVKVRWQRLELIVWAFLLAVSFNSSPFGVLAWFSLVRPLWIIGSVPAGSAFSSAYFFSFFFVGFSIWWVALVTTPGTIVAVLVVGCYYSSAFMLYRRLYQVKPILGYISFPLLWVGIEYFRTLSEFAFPWSDLGYTQSYFPVMIQIVSAISVHGLSLIIVAVNVLLLQMFRSELLIEKRLTSTFVALGLILTVGLYGWVALPPYPEKGEIKLALLQGSVPLEVKWAPNNQEHSYRLYDSLTQATSDSGIQLFVWPETAAPSYLSHDPTSRRRVAGIAERSGVPHLVGALGATQVGDQTKTYNSCYQFESIVRRPVRYDKINLVPFSEHVPYQDHLVFLRKGFLQNYLTFLDQDGVQFWSDFYPGDSILLFDVDDYSYGVLICFEAGFPEYSREMIHKGANFLVGITNDTWFGRSVGIHQHSRIFITRAIENRCWMARVANTGLTYIVDPYGRIRHELELYEVAVLVGEVGSLDEYSIFTEYGDIAGKTSFVFTLSLAGVMVSIWIARRTRKLFS